MNIALATFFSIEHGMGHLSRLRLLLDELKEPKFKKKLYIQYHDKNCLEIAKRYFIRHAEDVVFYNNFEIY